MSYTYHCPIKLRCAPSRSVCIDVLVDDDEEEEKMGGARDKECAMNEPFVWLNVSHRKCLNPFRISLERGHAKR